MMTQSEVIKKYGMPNETGAGYLVKIQLPYKMRIAWDTDSEITSIMCHKLVADKLTAIFNSLLVHYGYEKIKEVGIDLI